ncbi:MULTISPECIES: endonuclease/exonuclease/phosphatase family protein [unclassified Gordonia (in: high G+C Gram-positive bacteria)]
MRRAAFFLLIVFGWVLLAVVAVAVWLHYYPSRGELSIYLTSAVPYAIVPGVLALVLFAALRRWMMLSLTVVASLALCYTQAPLWVSQTAPAGERFTVVSSNLLFGGADIDQLASIVADADADLVSLQELTPEALAKVRAGGIGRQLPYSYAIPGPEAVGSALLSKHPLTDQAQIPNTVLHNLSARTSLPGAPDAQVLAIHPAAPLRGQSNTWLDDFGSVRDYLRSLPPGPAIAAGDYNATWDQARFRELLQNGFAAATDQAGAGFVPTFPTDRWAQQPLIGIDHVLVRGFVATSVHTHELRGSDHRTIVVNLVAG